MKQRLRCQRILILSLLSFSVLAPVVFLSSRIGRFSPSFDQSREFVEDIPGIKYHSDALQLNSIEQEGGEGLKEPEGEVLKDRKHIETVVGRNVSVDDVNGKDKGDAGKIVGSSNSNGSRAQMVGERVIKGVSFLQNVPSAVNTPAAREASGYSRHRPVTYENISAMKDQLIMAKAYLQFSPSNSNSHLVRELKLRIKEIERVLGQANKDSDLSRSALQKIRAMEASLSKASKIYPDCHALSIKLRAMAYNNEEQLRTQKNQASYLVQLAARTFPKGLHCLAMQLTADYFSLQPEERELSKKQKVQQADLYHYAIFSDNILASSVVVNSTVASSTDPSKIVFHVVTDTLNFPAMAMWFLTNPPRPAVVHIENMDHFDWLPSGFSSALKRPGARDPRYSSPLNHLSFYLPQIFPYLDKVLLLDHDVVVRRDLRGLWKVDMKGKVNAAVELCRPGDSSHRLEKVIDFSDPNMAKNFSPKSCAWALGMNVFDLHQWRKQGLTSVYERWLHSATRGKSFKAGGTVLPLGLLTFYNQTLALDRRWHVLGLGYDPNVSRAEINRAAVIHFDGNMKPWLEIGMPKYRGYWSKFIDYDNPHLRQCNIHD